MHVVSFSLCLYWRATRVDVTNVKAVLQGGERKELGLAIVRSIVRKVIPNVKNPFDFLEPQDQTRLSWSPKQGKRVSSVRHILA